MSRGVRLLLGLVIAVAVVALLFGVVFPWVDRTFVTNPVLGLRAGFIDAPAA